MTMTVTMKQTRMGESGSLLVAGSSYSVSDAFGAFLVGAGLAADPYRVLTPPPSELSQAQVTAAQALVSGAGTSLSGATYDGSNRCTGFTLGTVSYNITGWGGSTVTVAGSDGSSRAISLDGSGRIAEVA